MRKIKILKSEEGDWVVLVLNGKIVAENHSLEPDEVLRALGIKFESLTQDGDDDFERWVKNNQL